MWAMKGLTKGVPNMITLTVEPNTPPLTWKQFVKNRRPFSLPHNFVYRLIG